MMKRRDFFKTAASGVAFAASGIPAVASARAVPALPQPPMPGPGFGLAPIKKAGEAIEIYNGTKMVPDPNRYDGGFEGLEDVEGEATDPTMCDELYDDDSGL